MNAIWRKIAVIDVVAITATIGVTVVLMWGVHVIICRKFCVNEVSNFCLSFSSSLDALQKLICFKRCHPKSLLLYLVSYRYGTGSGGSGLAERTRENEVSLAGHSPPPGRESGKPETRGKILNFFIFFPNCLGLQ